MGRPREENAKRVSFKFRISEEEDKILEELSFNEEKTKAEILREALKMYHKFKKYC